MIPKPPPPIATTGWSRIEASRITGQARVEPNGVIVYRFVAGYVARLVGVRKRQAADTEVGAQFRPVEPPAGRDEHEDVIVVATADDDRPEQRGERHALQAGAFFGAAGPLGPDDAVGNAGRLDGGDRERGRGLILHAASVPATADRRSTFDDVPAAAEDPPLPRSSAKLPSSAPSGSRLRVGRLGLSLDEVELGPRA